MIVGQKHCGSGDLMILFFHMTWREDMFKGSLDFMSRHSSLNITTLSSFVAICNVAKEMFLICHLISQDPVIN